MDLNEVKTILEAHTHDGTLTLPPEALLSAPIAETFRTYLLGNDLVIRQVSIVQVSDQNITAVGQGTSFPFANSYVTAAFTVPGGVAAMFIETDGFYDQTNVWNFGRAFPVLADTFYKDLQFTRAEFTLRSSNAAVSQPPGLFFSGTLELAGPLAVLGKLLNDSTEADLFGPIRIDGEKTPAKAVPVMVLEDPDPGSEFGLEFFFRLVVEATVVEDEQGNQLEIVAVPLMQFVSRITVDAESGPKTVEISTHFSTAVGLLIFQADLQQLLVVSLAALNSLARGANLGNVLPPQLPLVNRFTLNQWSMSVVPEIPKITNISMGAAIAQPWTVIPGLFTLEAIDFAFTMIYREGKIESTAALTGAIKLLDGDAQFTLFVDAQYPRYVIIGSLEDPEIEEDDEIDFGETDERDELQAATNEIDLIALVRWILGQTIADSLPCKELKVTALTLLIDPNNSTFTLDTVIKASCSFDLGLVTFTLTEIHFNFSYVAAKATGNFVAAFWLLLPETRVTAAELFTDDPPDGAVPMQVSAAYNGAEDGWSFRGTLANKGQIDLRAIVERYLPEPYWAFIPDVVITQLEAGFETGTSRSYDFSIGAEWNISLLNTKISGLVKVASTREGGRRKDQGEIRGTLRFGGNGDEGGLVLKVKAVFDDLGQNYEFDFLGATFKLKSTAKEKILVFKLGSKSLGEMIEILINAVIPGADISLTSPWSVLNSLSLGDFDFVVKFDENSSPQTAGLKYPKTINLGFARLDEFVLDYDVKTEQVMFRIVRGQFLGKEIGAKPVQWNVAKPETTPAVPGQGTELFRLDFLGLGQHMGVVNKKTRAWAPIPPTVFGAVAQLAEAFKDDKDKELTLVFNEASDWLIGTRFMVIQAVDIGIVFYDPELFGVVVSVTGSKAKEKLPVFEGLVFEVLYKKINDTIGMWQINLTLPVYIRRLEFGAVSVTLPSLKLQIYTNGDFLIDLGFPTNGDFSRSFALQAFPFVGAGGVYFGKLSNATSNAVPQTSAGSFSPIIAFGLGLRIGLGKDLKYGPLKAGMSVTIEGVLEGVFAWYNPYPTALSAGSPGEQQLLPAASRKISRHLRQRISSAGGDDVYYMIQARVALVGKIYGKVDLKIIEATLDIEIRVSLRLVLQAYRAIDIFFEATISLTLRVRINLGLFKVTINLSYNLRMSFGFTIGSNSTPPWGPPVFLRQSSFMRQLDAAADEECPVIPVMKWQPIRVDKPVFVPLLFVPQFTAGTAGPLGAGSPRKPYIVAMTYVSSTQVAGALSPFDDIAQSVLLWTLNAYLNSDKDDTPLDQLLSQTISIDQLNEIYCYLTQPEVVEPFTEAEVLDFLRNYFTFHVTIPNDTSQEQDVSIFPILPLLSLTTSTGIDVDFSTQTPASAEYLASIKAYFEQMAVRYKGPSEKGSEQSLAQSTEDGEKSLASFVFLDFFAMLARSTVQDAISYLQAKEAPLDPNESLANFVQRRTDLAIDVASLALANATRPLRAGVELRVPGVVYTVKRGDTLQSIAARFDHDILELREANPLLNGRLTPAAELRLPPIVFTTSTTKPESLLDISRVYGVSLAEIARANQDVAELFAAGEPLLAPFAQQEKIGHLVFELQHNGSFNQLSGLAARVLLQGLRPPAPADSPQAGTTAPLYELTGQQFDASGLADGDTITLTAPEADRSWFRLGLGVDNSLTYPITARTAEMLASLQSAAFGPVAKFERVKLLRIEPRRFTLATSTVWHTPDTQATANLGMQLSAGTVEPRLWQFPSELMEIITGPQALQPKVELWKQRQEGPGQEYPREPVVRYLWSTKIEIQVRRTASGDNVFLPCTYEMTGIDAGASQILENLLVSYASKDVPNIYQLQILYPPNPVVPGQDHPPVGLKSDADPTFFLLQTNLSTASQPPQLTAMMTTRLSVASSKQAPLGQLDIEFLKLLWESSVVNSGGYVLYYQAEAGNGLPNYLFSQDGIATLTLLITYSMAGNVLHNYLNSVVIYEAIDIENEVLYASPVPQTVSNFNLAPDQSLADVAARYRVTVSQLATQYNNAHARLAPGRQLRIPPVTYRVGAGDRLETIAARANVTPQSIVALNASTNTADLSAVRFLRIPETIWRVAAGDSLASLAERFSTTVVALAHANKNVPGLVEENLQFDDRLEVMIPTIPPGNVAFSLRRSDAARGSADDDPQEQLAQLYNLLAYRIKPGNGFEATNSALPVSPITPKETADWVFQSVVPVFPFVTPAADVSEVVPDPRQDPYNGVGSNVELNFNWQDLFGNWLDSDVQHQSWPDQPFEVGYIDEIIALDEWPSVTSDYVITGNQPGIPELTITLRFNTDFYLPAGDPEAGKELALADIGKFELIYYQLTQPDVNVTVSSTMQPVVPAAEPPVQLMVQFVLDIINFLTTVIELRPDPPERLEAAISQPVADENPRNLFALTVRLEISRSLHLVKDEFKDIPSVYMVSSPVPANAGNNNAAALTAEPVAPLSLQEFAERLETAFPDLKVLVAAPKKGLSQTDEEIWLARFAATDTGIAFSIEGDKPSFFAAPPLARNLLSRPNVFVYPYQSGKFIGDQVPIKTSQNSVDLDQMGRDFLTAMEEVLGPQFAAATWKLEYDWAAKPPPVFGQPTNPYETILAAKKLLADSISARVVNVFETASPDAGLADAAETFRQQLLVNLTAAFTVDVLMQYPVEVTNSQYAATDPFAPQLFGKPVTQNPDDPEAVEQKDAYSFSTGKFSLAKRPTGTHLTFSFDTNREQQGRDGSQFDDVFTIDLFHQLNALEHEIHPVSGIRGYLASSWLTFVLPDSFEAVGDQTLLVPLGTQTIPVPLRAYPTPPSLSEQTFIPHAKQFAGDGNLLATNNEDQLLRARLWNYRCQYEYVGAAHDKILADVKLNVPAESMVQAQFNDLDSPDLFASLVQFTAAYPGIAKDLDQYLAKGIEPGKAWTAITSFAWLAQRTANAWRSWQPDRELFATAPPEYHFVIAQHAEMKHEVNALVVSVTADGDSRLPSVPRVEIAGYKTEPLKWPTADSGSYFFVSLTTHEILTYEDGRNLSSRSLVFTDFDVLKVENAWAGAAVKRNEDLLPDTVTNPDFILQSPVVRFINVLTPLLDPAVDIDIADYTSQPSASLAWFLSNFLTAFFAGAETAVNELRTIRMGASYSYGLDTVVGAEAEEPQTPDLNVTIPILLTLPTSISIANLSPDNPFIRSVADTITAWFKNNKPTGIDSNGRLWFDLSVYSSLSESQLPVLRMRRLFLKTSLLDI